MYAKQNDEAEFIQICDDAASMFVNFNTGCHSLPMSDKEQTRSLSRGADQLSRAARAGGDCRHSDTANEPSSHARWQRERYCPPAYLVSMVHDGLLCSVQKMSQHKLASVQFGLMLFVVGRGKTVEQITLKKVLTLSGIL